MKNYFIDIPQNITDDIVGQCESIQRSPIHIFRESDHPEDDYLYRVVSKSKDNNLYAEHCYNSSYNSLNNSIYDLDYPTALQRATSHIKYYGFQRG